MPRGKEKADKRDKLLKSKNGAFLCYGERPMYPFDTPFDFLGNRIVPIRGTPNCSPANYHPLQKNIAYDSKHFQCSTKGYSCRARTESRFRPPFHTKTPAVTKYFPKQKELSYQANKLICSKKGYSCGARTEERFRLPFHTVTPAAKYQAIISEPRKFTTAKKPFNSSEPRQMRFRNNITFPYYADEDIHSDDETPDIGALSCTPGVGRYDHDVERDRQVAKKWKRAFMKPELPSKSYMKSIRNIEMVEDRVMRKYQKHLNYMKLFY
ncbi:unnamed protein product [Oikopleura dioica]|uniref:Uncharacterized protein n=1 Tax=Oikopleura dioica TaxID=34765 RepID=E4XGF3_OIKDI|nr:unnamed protein product [Oikopleura dioica]CBY42041.1 unnamed protein product [Oikopleura dioica]